MTRSISLLAADDRVELALAGQLGQVAAEAVEGRGLGLALAGCRSLPPLAAAAAAFARLPCRAPAG